MLSVLPLGVLMAQEEKDYLPKAGDLAIGIDMEPVYRFFGNMFADGQGVRNGLNQFGGEAAVGLVNDVTIMGKYMLDNTTAIRFNVGVAKNVRKNYDYRIDDKALFVNPLSEAKVEDYYKHNAASYSIAAGIEFRRGKNRIQGYYGADLVFGVEKDRYDISYGNAITEINQIPSRGQTWDPVTLTWNYPYNNLGNLGTPDINYWTQAFLTESFEKRFILGVAGKFGVEYFVVPKLSFGGEVSLLLAKDFHKGSYTKSEGYNSVTERVENHTELVDPRNSTSFFGTTNLGGKLFMMFYF